MHERLEGLACSLDKGWPPWGRAPERSDDGRDSFLVKKNGEEGTDAAEGPIAPAVMLGPVALRERADAVGAGAPKARVEGGQDVVGVAGEAVNGVRPPLVVELAGNGRVKLPVV